MAVLSRPIRSLPSVDENGQTVQVAVTVVPITWGHIKLWETQVQPLVDRHYCHHRNDAPSGPGIRADVGWNWQTIYYYAAVHSLLYKPALAMCLVVKQAGAPEFPIGMLTAVPRLPCTAFGLTRDRGFAWYLADAPTEAYRDVLKVPPVKGVATVLIDCSLQATFDASGEGTHLLHADPRGGPKLTDFYIEKCRMTQLPTTNGPVTTVLRRGNPAEYFHFDDDQAKAFCAAFEARR